MEKSKYEIINELIEVASWDVEPWMAEWEIKNEQLECLVKTLEELLDGRIAKKG